jgi:hypothetical protein
MSTAIDPIKAEHRALRFNTIDDALAEIERIAAAERAGTLRTTGNWSFGQIFGHLATWIDFPYDGYPDSVRPPWILKLVCRMMKGKFLRGPLPRGSRIPNFPEGTLGTERLSTDEGHARVVRAFKRLQGAPPLRPSPIFGVLTHEEWIAGNLRHAELHLGYLHP